LIVPRKILPAIVAIAALSAALVGAGSLRGDETALVEPAVQVGDTVPPARLHIVTYPGLYGLGPDLPGSKYAVVDGYLLRVDPESRKVQSVIRRVDAIRD